MNTNRSLSHWIFRHYNSGPAFTVYKAQYWSVCWYFNHFSRIKGQLGTVYQTLNCPESTPSWHCLTCLFFPSRNPLVAVFAFRKQCQIWVIFSKFTWMQMLPTAVATDSNLLERISILISVSEASKRCYVQCGSTSCYLLASLQTGGKEHLEVQGVMRICFISLKGFPSKGLTC